MAKDESSASPSDSEYSSEEESRRRRRRREKKKRRHSRKKYESSSGSEDEKDEGKLKRKRKSHISDDDESGGEKKRRKRRHEKRKKRRHRHHSSDDESESESERRDKKKLLKQAKQVLRETEKRLREAADPSKKLNDISEDDYYLKSNEFATWLKENHGLHFSSLSAEETRARFVKFVDAWNSGSLPGKFYEGIQKMPRCGHKWNFGNDSQVDEEDKRVEKRKKEKAEQKKFQKEHELVMDELLPQATGKDRLLEKRAIQREKNRNRDLSPEPMKESDIMGGGNDFKAMLAREQARREKKTSQKRDLLQKKLSAAEEKESAAMDRFRALVNTAGGKISIPKRTG